MTITIEQTEDEVVRVETQLPSTIDEAAEQAASALEGALIASWSRIHWEEKGSMQGLSLVWRMT